MSAQQGSFEEAQWMNDQLHKQFDAGVRAAREAVLGYVVLAKRPDIHRPGEFDYQPAGGIWPTIEPCENHQAYCQMSAEAEPERYGDVEYVIASLAAIDALQEDQ